MSWQPPTSKFNLILAGFVGGMAVASVVTRYLPDPEPVYLTGEQSIREWIAAEGLPVLRAQSKSFAQDYSELDKSLAQRQGPSAEFCAVQQPMLRSRVKLHETIAARDKEVDNGTLKLKRLRTEFEEREHAHIADFQDTLLVFCQVMDTEKALRETGRQLQEIQRLFKP